MNSVTEEMMAVYNGEELMHIGMPRRSGRYPWGSGEDPYQHNRDFLGRIEELKKSGWSESAENIQKEFGMTTTQYRAQKALAKSERRSLDVARAKSLKEDGLGATEIGKIMGVRESTVRSWLDPKSEARMYQAKETADFIKERLKETGGAIDIGTGVERELHISKERMKQALALLENEGYVIQSGRVEQATNKGQWTTVKAIMPPGTDRKDFYKFTQGEASIHSLNDYVSADGGDTFQKKFTYPASMDSKRLSIRYNEDGGLEKDGIIELRRGVPDLSLGENRYAQVRILVDNTHFLKGMAVYSDNMPDGVDVVFNTNKKKGTPMTDVLKEIKKDPDNPFGSAIKDADKGGQYWYDDPVTGKKKLGLINKRADEGDWDDWKDALPSQFLSKQSLYMAKKQLNLAAVDKIAEFDEICSCPNPTVKKHALQKFADECDSAAVHLQAAALPGQKYHVIIPNSTLKDTEIYAPGYENGTKLALVRYPHGGTFEIPICTVNNKNALGKKLIGTTPIDAVCINSKVAERLSGADFDGDTVMCIPTHDKAGKVKVTSTPPLKGLEGFDPKVEYGFDKKVTDSNGETHYYRNGKEFKVMKNKGTQMGIVSNLITDMTLKGADDDELAAAVRHSMVVIDAEKHKLDYKQSEIDNNISALKKKYQRYVDENGKEHVGGASTLISRAKSQAQVLKRQGNPNIDPETGKQTWDVADDVEYQVRKVDKRTGKVSIETRYKHQTSTKMAETDDARTLISDFDTPMERAYADYANKMKSLANQARKEMMNAGKIKYDSQAKEVYRNEVNSLMSKLNTALLNAPRERQAQIKANAEVNAKIKALMDANPGMKRKEAEKEIDVKKASQRALSKYRQEVSAVSRRDRSIKITDKEWEAIQAGAISENKLKQILDNTDVDNLRQRITPRSTTSLSTASINRIKSMSASNYTIDQIARMMNVSTSTVSKYLKGVN